MRPNTLQTRLSRAKVRPYSTCLPRTKQVSRSHDERQEPQIHNRSFGASGTMRQSLHHLSMCESATVHDCQFLFICLHWYIAYTRLRLRTHFPLMRWDNGLHIDNGFRTLWEEDDWCSQLVCGIMYLVCRWMVFNALCQSQSHCCIGF